MPLTDPERDFLDHFMIEEDYPKLGVSTAHKLTRERGLNCEAMSQFSMVRGQEWQAWELPYATLDFVLAPKLPDHQVVCPWVNKQVMRERWDAVTTLTGDNAILSRDFRRVESDGFINLAPNPEHSPVIYFQPNYQALDNWVFRGRFGGIQRGRVSEELQRSPVSVWDPIRQPPMATQCHYLVIIETKPEPIRVWNVSRADIFQLVADEDVYRAIFRDPPSP